MRDRLERILIGLLVFAALAMSGAVIRREFRASHATKSFPEPEYVADWERLLQAATLIGDAGARVKIIEFGDFECPFCRTASYDLRRIQQQSTGKTAIAFVHFPLRKHRFAIPAARAAICADDEGRFADMYDRLYDGQDSLGLKSWASFALSAGVRDTSRFNRCVTQPGVPSQIQAGLDAGARLGVRATPTIVVNGWRFARPPTPIELSKAIDSIVAGRRPGR